MATNKVSKTARSGVSRAVGNARLTKLALFLLALPDPKAFNYGTWFEGTSDELKGAKCGDPNICGTTACALGWAPSIPSIRKAGLVLEIMSTDLGKVGDVVFKRNGKRYYGTAAGEQAFGLNPEEASFLFLPGQKLNGVRSPDSNSTAKDVAHHILAFVASRTTFR
jgi:hypothetical protein